MLGYALAYIVELYKWTCEYDGEISEIICTLVHINLL